MKENLIDVNTDNNDNDYIHSLRPSENINNVSLVKHISDMPLKDDNKGSELMLRKTINHMKKTNKLHRYKIGLIFYSIYIAVNMVELIVTILYKYNFDYEPFCETYLRYSAFTILLFLSPFLNKTNSSKLFDIINITKYYIPDWKKKKMEIYPPFFMYLKEQKKNLTKQFIKYHFCI